MIELSDQQVNIIEEKLQALGLNYSPLQGEILDHACCMIEEKIQAGQTFDQASQTIFEIFGKDELKNLQQQTISFTQKKSLRMKNFLLALLALLIIPSSIFVFYSSDKKGVVHPPSPQEVFDLEKRKAANGNDDSPHLEFESLLIAESTNLLLPHEPPNISPLGKEYKVHSEFGNRFHPIFKKKQFHTGIDFVAPLGTPVVATADGEVLKIVKKDKGGHGKFIILKHDEDFKTKYSHLSEIQVELGQIIKKGDVIGLVGNTGKSTGPHLHYEVIKNGKPVNPIAYLNP